MRDFDANPTNVIEMMIESVKSSQKDGVQEKMKRNTILTLKEQKSDQTREET